MISAKKLIKLARKWQRQVVLKRKRISIPRSEDNMPSTMADKGHFVFYTRDRKRFMCHMSYLNSNIFRELLAMSEEEFGLPGNGPITMTCDSAFMEYLVSLMRRNLGRDIEETLLMSLASNCHHSTSRWCSLTYCSNQGQQHSSQLLVSSY